MLLLCDCINFDRKQMETLKSCFRNWKRNLNFLQTWNNPFSSSSCCELVVSACKSPAPVDLSRNIYANRPKCASNSSLFVVRQTFKNFGYCLWIVIAWSLFAVNIKCEVLTLRRFVYYCFYVICFYMTRKN